MNEEHIKRNSIYVWGMGIKLLLAISIIFFITSLSLGILEELDLIDKGKWGSSVSTTVGFYFMLYLFLVMIPGIVFCKIMIYFVSKKLNFNRDIGINE